MFNLFGKKTGPSMAGILDDMKQDPSLRVFDTRSAGEYRGGHIPGSVNLPLDALDDIEDLVPDKDTKIYLYCASGSRSGYAALMLKRRGYSQVFNAGGIMSYAGPIAR